MQNENKIILVSGASSGIGMYCASSLHNIGHTVYGSIRKENVSDFPFKVLKMDVNIDESVEECVKELIDREGRIDVVVNCAGFGIAGSVEDTSIEEAKAQFETNLFGTMRVCRAMLPHMRERKSGLIINISSLGGLVSAPFHGLYCASKFAVEGLTEALRMEVAQFGVRVVLIEPGDFKTKFTANRIATKASGKNPAYKIPFESSLKVMEENEKKGPEPEVVAKLIGRIIETRRPRLRYVAAPGFQKLVPLLKKIIPGQVIEKEIMKHFKLFD